MLALLASIPILEQSGAKSHAETIIIKSKKTNKADYQKVSPACDFKQRCHFRYSKIFEPICIAKPITEGRTNLLI
jgi:hypothetical protein